MPIETRTGFATRPGETAEIRRFPIVAGWDGDEPDDQVLVRHNGKNVVYANPAALAAAIRAAQDAGAAASRLQRRRDFAAQAARGALIGFLASPFVAAGLIAVIG